MVFKPRLLQDLSLVFGCWTEEDKIRETDKEEMCHSENQILDLSQIQVGGREIQLIS